MLQLWWLILKNQAAGTTDIFTLITSHTVNDAQASRIFQQYKDFSKWLTAHCLQANVLFVCFSQKVWENLRCVFTEHTQHVLLLSNHAASLLFLKKKCGNRWTGSCIDALHVNFFFLFPREATTNTLPVYWGGSQSKQMSVNLYANNLSASNGLHTINVQPQICFVRLYDAVWITKALFLFSPSAKTPTQKFHGPLNQIIFPVISTFAKQYPETKTLRNDKTYSYVWKPAALG